VNGSAVNPHFSFMAHNTLQIYLRAIYFDRPTLAVMRGYVASFARANVDGEVQMYLSPASFRIRRIDAPGRPDLVHAYDGDGLMVASFPTANLSNVSLTTFFVRDLQNARDAGALLSDLFKDHGAARELLAALEPLVALLPKSGAAGSMVIRLLPKVASLISELLKSRKDGIKIYADGSRSFQDPEDFEDSSMVWGVSRSDRGYFRTSWDFCSTSNPYAVVRSLTLPDALKAKLGIT